MEVLGAGPIFEIVRIGDIARCTLMNRDDITPEEGAHCSALIDSILRDRVLVKGSPFTGLIFDVRRGPPVFGPKTRANLEKLFEAGERAGKRIAVRVGDAAIQKLQFSSLCRDHAPRCARVFDGPGDEAWVSDAAA